jgi:hypothetical protein
MLQSVQTALQVFETVANSVLTVRERQGKGI